MSGHLYVAATPIGNLADISSRLAQVLESADLIVAEDTRVSSRLLAHLGLKRPLRSLHEHNERQLVDGLVQRLEEGQTLVLISDAGTPLISDPGFRLISAAHDRCQSIVPVPGPSAVIAALSVAGLPTDRFTFRGFLAARSAQRRRQLEELKSCIETTVLFEACHRIGGLIDDAIAILGGDRLGFLAREMTKRHEQYVRASLAELSEQLGNGSIPAKGEFVLLLAGNSVQPAVAGNAALVLAALAEELPASQAARLAARLTGLPRKQCFEQIKGLKSRH